MRAIITNLGVFILTTALTRWTIQVRMSITLLLGVVDESVTGFVLNEVVLQANPRGWITIMMRRPMNTTMEFTRIGMVNFQLENSAGTRI